MISGWAPGATAFRGFSLFESLRYLTIESGNDILLGNREDRLELQEFRVGCTHRVAVARGKWTKHPLRSGHVRCSLRGAALWKRSTPAMERFAKHRTCDVRPSISNGEGKLVAPAPNQIIMGDASKDGWSRHCAVNAALYGMQFDSSHFPPYF